jgi:hypothetical protein
MRNSFSSLAAAIILSAAGCASETDEQAFDFETGPTMQPGDNCVRCHGSPNSDFPSAPEWTAAGTVFAGPDSPTDDGIPGVRVLFMDSDGALVEELTTNSVGNFYTAAPLPDGFRVAVEYEDERIDMPCAPPSGGCAACHNQPPIGGAPGRIFIPQAPEAADVGADCGGFQ